MTAFDVELAELTVTREDPLTGERREVARNVSLKLSAGSRLALVGPNGAGKSSVLLALVGATPFSGEIRIGPHTVADKALAALRRDVGFVFADPSDQLFCASVEDEVAFGPLARGWSEDEVERAVGDALERVGLSAERRRAPQALSLGEQRRLALATALACRPGLLILDEPTASLDGRARRTLLRTLLDSDATLICASHDLDAVLDLDAEVLLLADGNTIAHGDGRELLSDAALLDRAGLEPPLSFLKA
jgi:cobalt/nickel transport system ATP-binding protein